MDPEIVKELQDVAKLLAPLTTAPALADIFKRLVGPTADLLGERLKRCVERSDKMIDEAKATPVYVVPSLCFPLIQAAALAESETLQEMFAALLANARIPKGNAVRPSFISIVSQLAPDEAVLFMRLAPLTNDYRGFQVGLGQVQGDKTPVIANRNALHWNQVKNALPVIEGESDQDRTNRMYTCLLVLDGLRLISRDGIPLMTSLGWALFNASNPPKPAS